MSLQFFKRLFGEHAAAQSHPLNNRLKCPNCNGPMSLTLVVPTLIGSSNNATYTCAECGHEETRMLTGVRN